MENQTWIKLFRKIVDHDIFNDESAFRVFMWILCSCDYKTGTMKSGRFWASERLGVNPITYYKILKRLEKKYDLVTLQSNNKNTTILVKKWNLYQDSSNNESNNKVTTKEQQSNTTQELRIKKDIYYQQADSNFTGDLFGMEIKAPKSFTKWQSMAVDYAGKLGIDPTASWFKFFKNGDEGKLQDAYAKMFGLSPSDPEKYFYKIYGGNYAPDTTK
jgi:hypothetical protein